MVKRAERNDPCPCGSGKKYKKCCLDKDRDLPDPLPPRKAHVSAPEPVEERWEPEEPPVEEAFAAPDETREELPAPEAREYPQPVEDLPDLPPDQQRIVDDWWEETSPWYRKRDADKLLQQVEKALTTFPELFAHLWLHQEFLFELGGEMGRRNRMPEYVALLKRLRREQRQMYSFVYGAYDSEVIAELVIAGQEAEIPDYLDFFRQYPDAEPDYCHETCDLLAWRGRAAPLYALCEAVATPMMTSKRIIGGDFALDWLIRREEIPFYEAGEATPAAARKAAAAIRQLGQRLEYPLRGDVNWMLASLQAYLQPRAVDADGPVAEAAQRRFGFAYLAHLRRQVGLSWEPSFFLHDLLFDYLSWCRREKTHPFRLEKKVIDRFTVYRSRRLIAVRGVLLLAIVQMIFWLADYLRSIGLKSEPEASVIQESCRQLFETGRKAVESTDPAYRICKTFGQLAVNAAG